MMYDSTAMISDDAQLGKCENSLFFSFLLFMAIYFSFES